MKLYLAGPDVFHPDAAGLGRAKVALCAAYGFLGLYPLDGGSPGDGGAAIYARCLAMMREADGGIFNLTPFRGPSADPGTVFELGVTAALGKSVFAYTNDPADLLERVRRDADVVPHGTGWRDPDGMAVEDFGNSDNLMLDETLAAQGRRIHRRKAASAARFTDLEGFEACLVEARRVFTVRRSVVT